MNKERIDELEKLAGARSYPGKWTMREHPSLGAFIEVPKQFTGKAYGLEVMGEDYNGFGGDEQREADIRFAQACDTAVPELLAAVKERDAEIERLKKELQREKTRLPHWNRSGNSIWI